jgi:hypothetical protein
MRITDEIAARCVEKVNEARGKLGKRALIHDPRLSVAAQASADKSSVHGRFVERFKEAGWPVEGRPPHDSRPDIGNFSEGTAPKGPKSFPEAVDQYIGMMTGSNLPPTEPHVWDFRSGWSRVGFGLNPRNGFFVIAYGFLPDDPDQAPTPEPEPAPEPTPTPGPDPTPGPTPGPDDESGWTFVFHK